MMSVVIHNPAQPHWHHTGQHKRLQRLQQLQQKSQPQLQLQQRRSKHFYLSYCKLQREEMQQQDQKQQEKEQQQHNCHTNPHQLQQEQEQKRKQQQQTHHHHHHHRRHQSHQQDPKELHRQQKQPQQTEQLQEYSLRRQQRQKRQLQHRLQQQNKKFEALMSDLNDTVSSNGIHTQQTTALPIEDTRSSELNQSGPECRKEVEAKDVKEEGDIEDAWRDFETVATIKTWDNILRERTSQRRVIETGSDGNLAMSCINIVSPINGNNVESKVELGKATKFLRAAMKMAVQRGNICDVRSLFRLVDRCGVSLDEDESRGGAYLSELMAEAVADGRGDIIEVLVQNGADPNQTHRDLSHLSRALASGGCSMIVTLIQNGVDPNQTTPTGKTILHEAASSSSSDVIKCLLDNGASPEIKDNIQGNTALHTACSYANRDAILALYDRGVEFNAVNHFGDTPLAKLLRPLTKAENFHNKTRLELAKDIIRIGFTLARKHNQSRKTLASHNYGRSSLQKDLPQTHLASSFVSLNSSLCHANTRSLSQRTSSNPGKTAEGQASTSAPEIQFNSNGLSHATRKTGCEAMSASHKRDEEFNVGSTYCGDNVPLSVFNSPSPSLSSSSILASSSSSSLSPTTTLAAAEIVASPYSNLSVFWSSVSKSTLPHQRSRHVNHHHAFHHHQQQQQQYQQHNHHQQHQEQEQLETRRHPHRHNHIHNHHHQQHYDNQDRQENPHVPNYPTKDDQLREMYHRLFAAATGDLSLQQRCRLAIIHSLGTKPMATNLNNLGLPNLVVRYIKQGGDGI